MLLYALLGLLVGSLLRAGSDLLPAWRDGSELQQPPSLPTKIRLAWLDVIGSFLRRCSGQVLRRCTLTGRWAEFVEASGHRSGQALRQSPVRDAALWRGLVVELGTMLLFAYLWRHVGFSWQLIPATLYTCLFILIFVIDVEHRLVLNAVILPAALLALLTSFISQNPGPGSALLGGSLGFTLFLLVALAYRGGLGGGDVKLAGLIGLITGFPQVVVALVIGVLIGGLVSLFLLLTRVKGRKSYIPYAPFLVMGAMVTMLHGAEIMAWYTGTINH
jgi:prepilin signal peptidase PulO-like enzyme (type II secretory pathway)